MERPCKRARIESNPEPRSLTDLGRDVTRHISCFLHLEDRLCLLSSCDSVMLWLHNPGAWAITVPREPGSHYLEMTAQLQRLAKFYNNERTRVLTLKGKGVPGMMECLTRCRGLEHLTLDACEVPLPILEVLCPRLKTLVLVNGYVETSADFKACTPEALQRLTRGLPYSRNTDAVFPELVSVVCQQLSMRKYWPMPLDRKLRWFVGCPKLRDVTLKLEPWPVAEDLARLPALRRLTLTFSDASGSLEVFAKCKNLEVLEFIRCCNTKDMPLEVPGRPDIVISVIDAIN